MAETGHNQNTSRDRGHEGRGSLHTGIDRRAFLAGLAATGALLALPGCARRFGAPSNAGDDADTSSATLPVEEKHLRIYIPNPAYIEPYDVSDVAGKLVASALFEPPLAYDFATDTLLPAAAATWNMSDEGTELTLELVPTATFHDGTPVNAQAFKRSWERTINPATDTHDPSSIHTLFAPIAGYQELRDGTADTLSGVKITGEHSLVVTLSYPYPDFVYLLTHPAFAPVPESASDRSVFAAAPIGNGPFMMDGKWIDEQYITVVRNNAYHGVIPEVPGIDFLIFRDESTAYLELEAGNVDFAAVPMDRFTAAQSAYKAAEDGMTITADDKLLLGDEMAVHYLALNCEDPAFAKPAFRRALSLAIDRSTLVTELFGDMYSSADGIIPPGMSDAEAATWASCDYDLEAAQAAMVEAGYPNGNGAPALTLTTDSTDLSAALLTRIKDFWGVIGVDTTVKVDTYDQYANEKKRGDFQVVDSAWMADTPLRDGIYEALASSTSEANISRYAEADFDTALLEARQTLDDVERTAAYDEIDGLLSVTLPVIPLFFYRHHHAASSNVEHLVYDPFCSIPYTTCELSEQV